VRLDNITLDDALEWGGGEEIRIRVEGHSGFGSRGNDLVCAGISAVVQSAIVGIDRVAKLRQRLVQRDGFLETAVTVRGLSPGGDAALKVIIHTMIMGLAEIARNYPDSMEITGLSAIE
jgi:uncharacterized protein YsxB (DUF464 family)